MYVTFCNMNFSPGNFQMPNCQITVNLIFTSPQVRGHVMCMHMKTRCISRGVKTWVVLILKEKRRRT